MKKRLENNLKGLVHPSPFLRKGEGFTLIEVLIVLAIFAMLVGSGLLVGMGFYRDLALTGERDTVVTLLRRARTRAFANTNETNHGVYVATTTYVLFQGPSYASRTAAFDEFFPRSSAISVTGTSTILFASLSGDANVSGTLALGNGRTTTSIDVNFEGRITWR